MLSLFHRIWVQVEGSVAIREAALAYAPRASKASTEHLQTAHLYFRMIYLYSDFTRLAWKTRLTKLTHP